MLTCPFAAGAKAVSNEGPRAPFTVRALREGSTGACCRLDKYQHDADVLLGFCLTVLAHLGYPTPTVRYERRGASESSHKPSRCKHNTMYYPVARSTHIHEDRLTFCLVSVPTSSAKRPWSPASRRPCTPMRKVTRQSHRPGRIPLVSHSKPYNTTYTIYQH